MTVTFSFVLSAGKLPVTVLKRACHALDFIPDKGEAVVFSGIPFRVTSRTLIIGAVHPMGESREIGITLEPMTAIDGAHAADLADKLKDEGWTVA